MDTRKTTDRRGYSRQKVLDLLVERRDELRELSVSSLALFGSVARDKATPESDLDVLVEFSGPATFDRYMDLKFYLEDLLGIPVDLVTRKALKPQLVPVIEKELLHVS